MTTSASGEGVSGSRVRQALRGEVVSVTLEHTLAQAARDMSDGGVDAAAIAGGERPGILTHRDLLGAVGGGDQPGAERVDAHFTAEATSVAPDASLREAAQTMIDDGFRHLVVVKGAETVGILSMRDIVGRWLADGAVPRRPTPIREAMTREILTVTLDDTLREAARAMSERRVGAAVVTAEGGSGRPQLVTERVVMDAVARGVDPSRERVGDHLSQRMTYSAPTWSLRQAAEAMTRGDFEHIVVVEPSGTVGVISMRDIVRSWTEEGRRR